MGNRGLCFPRAENPDRCTRHFGYGALVAGAAEAFFGSGRVLEVFGVFYLAGAGCSIPSSSRTVAGVRGPKYNSSVSLMR